MALRSRLIDDRARRQRTALRAAATIMRDQQPQLIIIIKAINRINIKQATINRHQAMCVTFCNDIMDVEKNFIYDERVKSQKKEMI